MIYKRSSELFLDAQKVIPGGVNSPVRAFKAVGGNPIFIKKAKGTYLHDEDNRILIDVIASWGPLICGHAFPPVLNAIREALESGISFGTPTERETLIAQLVIQMVPHIEQVRFVNSGTEACMSAIRLARGYTKKEKIIKFEGCYHGHADAFLINPGSGVATLGKPSSEGLTKGIINDTLVAQYNDIESVNTILENYPNQIAALIIEPVAGNMGCITPQKGFLEGLRRLCDKHHVLLIFDEVMTGFRISRGGAQERYNLSADIITFGKIIGGGLPVGAFAAKKEIMNLLSPNGNVYQAGTLSGNPLAMASGLALLNHLNSSPNIYINLENKGQYLENGLEHVLKNTPIPFSINRCGSMISVHFSEEPVVDFKSAVKANNHIFKSVFHQMLEKGIYLPPSAFESWFLNDAMSYDNLDKIIHTFEATIKSI